MFIKLSALMDHSEENYGNLVTILAHYFFLPLLLEVFSA